jgi:hypothetical protein
LPLPEFLLRRNSNGTYTVQTNLTPGNRYQINQWGLASTVVKLVDFNADGYMDILLTALSPASVSPNDILVFASTGQGAPPLKTRLMDNWVRAFAIDLLSYVDDPAYFNGAYQYECAIYSYTPFYFPRYDIDGYYWGTSIPFPYVVCGWETNPAFNSTAVTIGASVRNVLNAGTVIAGSTDAGWLGWGMSNVLGVPYMGGTLQTGTTLLPVDLIVDIQDDLALVRFRRVLGGFMQLLQYELGTQTPYETHFYTFTSTICAVSDNPTVCSVENVFRRVRQYPVDGHSIDACGNVPRSRCSIPIQTQTQIVVEVFEWPGDADDVGHVTVTVDLANHTIVNQTASDHAFHDGSVTRRVYQDGNTVKIETIGDGAGQYAQMNEVFGPPVFKMIDNVIAYRIIMEMAGIQIP